MKKPDILWIIVDSVRTYRTGIDDRDRIDIIDEMSEEGIEFLNTYASAPSSVLSGSSMFTGLNACFISRHFNDWDFDQNSIESIFNTTKKLGYENYSIFNSREERRMLKNLIHPISSKFYPKGVSHRNWWTNKECTDIFLNALNRHDKEKPAFFTVWYDCRKDINTSKEVKRAIEAYKESGRYDNSIFILCSDHGYPDPSTGLTEQTMKKYSHDMIITEDNIKVPLILKYPNGPSGIKIHQDVGSVDIYSTICEILNIPDPNSTFKFRGASLLEIIKGEKKNPRVSRIDTRLNYAESRVTALVKNRLKYVVYWDDNIEELFDLNSDPYEVDNLFSKKESFYQSQISEFRKILDEMEKDINVFHKDGLVKTFILNIRKLKTEKQINGVKNIILATKSAPNGILEAFLESAKHVFSKAQIHLYSSPKVVDSAKSLSFDSAISLKDSKLDLITSKDLIFFLTQNSKSGFIDDEVLRSIKNKGNNRINMIDYNFMIYNRFLSNWVWPLMNYFKSNAEFYKDEPSMLFYDIFEIIGKMLSKLVRKKASLPVDGNKIKKMRDRQLKAETNQ